MGRWAGWAVGLALLAGCGTRTGVGAVSGVEQQDGPDGGGGGAPSCMGPTGSLLWNAGSGAPSCADLFRPLGPGEDQPWIQGLDGRPGRDREECGVAFTDGSQSYLQVNSLIPLPGGAPVPHLIEWVNHNGSNAGGSTIDTAFAYINAFQFGFAFVNHVDEPHPLVLDFIGYALTGAPNRGADFSFPGAPAAAGADPQVVSPVGGVVVAGGPGFQFPCDCPNPPGDTPCPPTCPEPPGVYLARYDGNMFQRFTAPRLFDQDPSATATVGVNVDGWSLLLLTDASGHTQGRWVNPSGDPQPVFDVSAALPSGRSRVLVPLVDGGLVLRIDGTWLRVFRRSGAEEPPPCWLTTLGDADVHLISHQRGYAAIPRAPRGCDQAILIHSADGTSCGALSVGPASEQCSPDHVAIGPLGDVTYLKDGPPVDAGTAPSCVLTVWSHALEPTAP